MEVSRVGLQLENISKHATASAGAKPEAESSKDQTTHKGDIHPPTYTDISGFDIQENP